MIYKSQRIMQNKLKQNKKTEPTAIGTDKLEKQLKFW